MCSVCSSSARGCRASGLQATCRQERKRFPGGNGGSPPGLAIRLAVSTNSSTALVTGLALILAPLSACTTNAVDVCQVGGARCTVDGEYEYIVVGSGAGGGPLASRFARAGKRVLLLEAGQYVGGNATSDAPD